MGLRNYSEIDQLCPSIAKSPFLEAGMVITIEPGVYIPGWGGIRIEDDVLVKRDGHSLLTTLPRELAEIEK